MIFFTPRKSPRVEDETRRPRARRVGGPRGGLRRPIAVGILPALILLAALPVKPAAAEGVQKYKPAMSSQQLEKKAKRLQALVEEKIVRQHGMIPMFVRASDYQLPTAEDYKGAYRHRHLKGKTEEELGLPPMHVWRAWENTATDTAYYLAASAYKYRATGDPKDLAICRRTFAGLKYIYGLTAAQGERGRLCKPYGGVWSNQSSPDQTQCVTWGLAAYRSTAPPGDLADYNKIIMEVAEYNIKADYDRNDPHGHMYFGWTREMLSKTNFSIFDLSYTVIFFPQLNLAWQATGDSKFLSETQRYYGACDLDKKPRIGQGAVAHYVQRGRAAFGQEVGNAGGAQRDLYLGALMMELDPFHHEIWRALMLTGFSINTSSILPDGTHSRHVGRSSIDAMGIATAQRWFPDMDMTSVARHILEKLDVDTFRFVRPGTKPPWAGAGDTLEQWAVESKLIDGDSLTAWLAAYWEGRWRGYW